VDQRFLAMFIKEHQGADNKPFQLFVSRPEVYPASVHRLVVKCHFTQRASFTAILVAEGILPLQQIPAVPPHRLGIRMAKCCFRRSVRNVRDFKPGYLSQWLWITDTFRHY
jgi:hypothetical protein